MGEPAARAPRDRRPRRAGLREPLAPAWSIAAAGPVRRALSPPLVRAGSLLPARMLRLDVHPTDLAHPRHMMALEWVLSRAGAAAQAITYDELAEA